MKVSDPHGHMPEKSPLVLLLIDVINDLEFPGNQGLVRQLPALVRSLSRLKERAYRQGVPVIYVNDNFGRWQSDLNQQIRHCSRSNCPGRQMVERLKPGPRDFFVLKPKHSGFHDTCLELLLQTVGASRLILAGIAADRCVLFTASDAHLRGYELLIPSDCVVANSVAAKREALRLMRRVLRADVRRENDVRWVAD